MRRTDVCLSACLWSAVFVGSACAVATPEGVTVSRGTSNRGYLSHAVEFPDEGPGFVRARPGERTRYGTPRLIAAITRAAAAVQERVPGSEPLRVGDLSYQHGGRHPRHGSHRSGRDVDLIYYATDIEGHPVRGRGWVAYDRFGAGREPSDRGGEITLFDVARNWELVRAFVLDEDAQVQWIFCSHGIKARLLEYAAAHEENTQAIFRASWVLHQPRGRNPHADHFHVRVSCGPEQRAMGCRDRGPAWPWLADAMLKNAASPALDDDAVIQALMGE